MKAYVLDTSALLYDPDLIYELGAGDMAVIPTAVIKELDIHKKDDDGHGRAARDIARTLDTLGFYKNLAEGGQLMTGTILRTCTEFKKITDFKSDIDNRVVGTALKLKGSHKYVAVVSRDKEMRDVARAHGLKAKNYPFSLTKLDEEKTQNKMPPSAKITPIRPRIRPEVPKIRISRQAPSQRVLLAWLSRMIKELFKRTAGRYPKGGTK
ncbi:MAG: PIN domain-containing protein [Nitrospiraceae bacterium]|nr:PIN domain-containing protein [Nitrospiraceae bacterium]MDA8090116.1 PIN domain-containing protein [Nitrospiraceae bacterium]